MVDDDTFTYHVKQQSANPINTAAHSLITKERMQKLDLLIHLLSNLTQALVVCGPEGIGKTTLLDVLQQRKTEAWRYCLIQGNADLSFEAIHGQLTRSMKVDVSVKSLSTVFAQYENQHKQVVLIVDNAGALVPGLIAAIIQYAAANPALRVVFALTHDELQVKRGSDRAVDDCHIIEIPPLSEKQCGDFLQDLSTKPYANLSFKAIGENMIAHIYRDTHGVPGRIIAEVSGLSGAKPGGKLKWILVLAVVSALAIAVGVQWLVSGQDKKVGSTPVAVEQKADVAEIVHPQPEAQIILPLPPAQPTIQPQQQPVPTKESNEALKPLAEVNVGGAEQQLVIPAAKPEASSTIVIKPLPEQLEIQPEPVGAIGRTQETDNKQVAVAQQKIDEPSSTKSQEKPKQPELSKAVNAVKSLIPEKTQIKAQSEPVTAAGIVQKAENKQADVSNVKMAERLWAAQEKLKQSALSKTANGVGMAPDTSNNLETIQIPPKPEGIAGESEQQATETRMPQNAETGVAPVSSANNFTLQLMVLSKQSSVNGIVKKYPAMEPDFRIIKSMVRGQEKFILEYGSYADAASANKARESLPFEFRKALVRKIAR